MNRISLSQNSQGFQEIDYTPHYHAITNAGKSQFSRVIDATAELVDNSIQASSTNSHIECRNINVEIHLKNLNSNGYLIVFDNGKGMNEKDLQEFATYSLDQETRGNKPSFDEVVNNSNSFISKFGVGAKQAGFFLGDSITIYTKKAESSGFLNFKLDMQEFKTRYDNNENVYKDKIYRYSQDTIVQMIEKKTVFGPHIPPSMNSSLLNFINNTSHGTAVIITLNAETLKRLSDYMRNQFVDLCKDLADVYHFHLHPENTPANIIKNPKFSDANEVHVKIKNDTNLPKLNIFIEVWVDNKNILQRRNLCDTVDLVTECIDRAVSIFRFTAELPDPYPNNNDPNLGPTQALSKQLAGELTGANLGETCRIEGYLFYFPYKSGHETRPLSYVNDEGIEDETTRYNNDPNVRIYWQKRLVPESTLKSLPFFPAFASKSQCITEKVPEKWRWRIKGFIFFDWNFRHISNNKLKIRVDNFEDWIHSKEVLKHISYSPSQCPANFKKFLQLCHAQYDKEFRLEGRDKILENALNTTFQIIPNSAFFTRVKIGNKHSIVKDEKIKIPLKGSKGLVYGKVIGFEVKEQLDPDENLYFGPANIWYSREPADIYGDKISIKHHPSIALIKFDETESFRVTKLDIETLRKLAPIDFKVGLFTSEGENPEIIKANAPFDVYTGVQYHKFGVQVINRKNEQICFIPPSSIDRYKVRVLYSNMPYDDKQDLHIYDESKGKDVKLTNFKEKALIMKAWYSFGNYDNGDKYKLEFTSIGQHKLKVILIDTVSAGVDQVILSKEYTINVRSVLIADFSLNVIDESTTLPLGNFLPKLSVEFQDQSKNPVDFESRIKITIKSNDMTVVCDNLSEPLFLVEASDHGLLNFDTCWMAIPKTDTKFFKDMNYILSERVVEFEVSIFTTNKNKSDEPEDYDIAIGNPKKFKLKFCPGRPYQLMLLDPFKVNDSYHIDEVIPYLKLGCVDQWGNRTGPRLGATWTISLDPNGPLKVYDENEFPMTSIGEVTIRNLKIEEMENHNELIGYETTQTFYLSINDKSFSFPPDEPDIVMPSQINFKEEPELTIKFLITSSNSPDHLEIRYQGVVISNPYELIVSTVLSDLSFHVIDGKGNEIEFQSDWFQKNNTGLVVSWSKFQKKKKGNNLSTNILPELIVPEKAYIPYECDVELLLTNFKSLSCHFVIIPMPSVKHRLIIKCSNDFDKGLTSNDSIDLQSKIYGIQIVDKFDNEITLNAVLSEDVPLLLYMSDEPTEDVINEWIMNNYLQDGKRNKRKLSDPCDTQSSKRLRTDSGGAENSLEVNDLRNKNYIKQIELSYSKEKGYFILNPDSAIETKTVPSIIWLIAIDGKRATCKESNYLLSDIKKIMLIVGKPRKFSLSCNSLNIINPQNIHDEIVCINKYTEIKDLMIYAWDNSNNNASLTGIKYINYEVHLIIDYNLDDMTDDMSQLYDDFLLAKEKNMVINTVQCPTIRLHKLSIRDNINSAKIVCNGFSKYLDGSEVHIKNAVINCNYTRINTITSLQLQALKRSPSTYFDTRIERDKPDLTIRCDEKFPLIKIILDTDDHATYIPPRSSFSYDIKVHSKNVSDWSSNQSTKSIRINNKPKSFTTISSAFELILPDDTTSSSSINDSNILLEYNTQDSIDNVGLTLGLYEVNVSYTEQRESMTSLPGVLKSIQSKLRIQVIPGLPTKISPTLEGVRSLTGAIASNSISCNPNERVIAENISINLYDDYSNSCTFPSDVLVKCVLNRQSNYELPILENSNDDGELFGVVSEDRNEFHFEKIAIKPNTGQESGLIDIHFIASNIVTNVLLSVYIVSFNFIVDVITLSQVSKLQKEFKIIEKIINDYNIDIISLNNELNNIMNEFKILSNGSDKYLRNYKVNYENVETVIKYDISLTIQTLKEEKEILLEKKESIRPPVISSRPNAALLIGKNVKKLVAELGFVEDEKEAQILSWAAVYHMDALVVADTQTGNELYKQNIKNWPMDQINKFYIEDRTREQPVTRTRNSDEIKTRQLPFPSLDGYAGNPKYMVNLIQLEESEEYLRDSLFYSIYMKSILFDDMISATAYRKKLIELKKMPPTIYTRNGEKISMEGILNPNKTNRLPPKLPYVYGQLPLVSDKDIQLLDSDIDLLENIKPFIDKHKQLKEDLLSKQRYGETIDIVSKTNRLEILRKQLQDQGMVVSQ